MPKYDVHLYALVRVKVPNVKARSQRKAIDKAEDMLGLQLYEMFYRERPIPIVDHTEYADEITTYLVDEVGDEEYSKSTFYDRRKEPVSLGD